MLVSKRKDGLYQIDLRELTNGKCELCCTKFTFKCYPYYILTSLLLSPTPSQCANCLCIDQVQYKKAWKKMLTIYTLRQI